MAKLTITKIHCTKTTTGLGDDELYYNYWNDSGSKERYPESGEHETSKGDDWKIDEAYTFTESFKLTLMEEDTIGDDTIASYTFKTSGNTKSPIPMNGDGGEFLLYYTLS